MKRFRNIKSIDCCDASSLVFYRCGIDSVTISDTDTPDWLSMGIEPGKSEASLVLSNKRENGELLFTAKLRFNTCVELPIMTRKAYRVELMDGKVLLIGSSERPFPETVVSVNHPKKVTENMLSEVEVDWSSLVPVPYII